MAGAVLRGYSFRNLVVTAIGASLFVIKSFMEEEFLKQDPAYVEYMHRVRWRWIPLVA
jgi:protein-S-isoprenylcysteine O-methyltransferase Ste14